MKMASISGYLNAVKVILLTGLTLIAFIVTSLDWSPGKGNGASELWSRNVTISAAAIILVFIYVLIIFEIVDKTLAALIGAFLAIAAHDYFLEYAELEDIIQWIDLETLSLLLGMMIISNILSVSGVFDVLATWICNRARGRFWLLLISMTLTVAFVSSMLDNVTSMLLLAPTIIKLGKLEKLDPRYLLITMTIFSNLGGTATPIGDPPNLIIISDEMVQEKLNITFTSFVGFAMPCVAASMLVTYVYLKLVFKSRKSFESEEYKMATFSIGSDEEDFSNYGGNGCKKVADELALTDQQQGRHLIKSKTILIQSVVVMTGAIILFFAQSFLNTKLTLGWISLSASLTLLVVSSTTKVPNERELDDDKEERTIFEMAIGKVEWNTLIFFFALFIITEVMSKLGLIVSMGQTIGSVINLIPGGNLRAMGAITIVLWSSGILSALIDNIPITSMMIKILGTMMLQNETNDPADYDLNIKSLVFALVFGVCFGGNGTLIGASANLVTANISNQHGYPITFNKFFKFSAPITVLTLIVSNVYLLFVFVLLKF